MVESPELIFFDTFSHDLHEKLNLDLVQFPNPVYIEEIRIIPLGARVAAQFPGGSNRLGATNPSQFDIEFYVNDLSVEFASTFEPLGKFSYNQNECINLECKPQDGTRKIPTDGLVLKGCYNTITLAVYGNIITYGTMSKIQNNNMSNTGNNNNAVQESSNDEANESENGEIYNSYHNHALNDFQDQNSSCDPTVSSTIDDLKEDDSLQPNSPPVDISSRSPSKEQEIPKNSKREWSMENSSPDGGNYRNKRARLYDRKNPRSPPLQSPRISRPESDDETKKEVGDLSSTFLCPSSPNTPIESPTDELDDAVDLEPILSDEEMIDEEVNGIDDLSEEMFAEEFPVKIFNPFEDELRVVERKLDEIKMTRVQEFLKGLSETTENHDWMQVCEEIHHHLIALKKHEVRAMITNIEDSLKDVIVKAIEKGLNFENAIQQLSPGCNLRYIKAGIKLVESLCFCGNFIMYLNETKNVNIFEKLFILLEVQQIPNPIKILTTRLVHKLIGTKEGVEIFLSFDGYKKVIDKLENTNDVRVLYTFRMILKKIHVFETLSLIRSSTLEIYSKLKNNEEIEFEKISELENLMETLISSRQLDVMQSKKFIPLPSQFELPIEHKSTGFVEFYSHFKLFELIILLIDLRHSISTNLVALVVDYIQLMLKDTLEFDYIANDVKLVNDLIKVLLEPPAIIGSDESQLNLDITLEITYKMESKYHLDWISQINDDDLELAECLESLYNLCMSPGKKHVLEYIALDENLLVFLNIIDKEKQNSILLKQKSPVLTFSIDIVDLVVRYVENLNYLCRYHKFLTTLVKYHESFEPSASAMLQEMGVYLKPLENGKGLVVDDISSYIEIIKRSMEVLTTFPGDLIMTLRILRHLTIGHNLSDYRELKYDFYAIQLYHVDGVSTLLSILDKLTTHFDQPMIHSYLLGANQGQLLMQVIHPTIQVLRKMLVNVIRARNVNFKDITAIETLLKTFTLTNSISRNFKTYKEAKEVQNEIIKILLTYTQSLTPDGMNTTNIHKSLWTQMIGEVIKFTLNGPFHFISGLSVISELLPLPLPVPVLSDLSESEKHQLITERQLWSAHLHPQSNQITELIQTFCTTSTPELMHILYRVCVQLADLAPNMTLLVSKAITEMITNENLGKNGEGTTSLARLIKLLANLVRNACVKVSVLSILNGKLSELLSQLLNHINDDNSEHVTTQYYVVLLINNLLDCEVSLLFNPINSNESSLVSGLPTKELLIQFTKDIVKCFCCTTADNLTYALVQSMILLTEHDITFNVLKFYIITQKDQFSERLNSIGEKCKSEKKLTSIIPDLVELFRALINVEVDMSTRTSSFNIGELSSVLKWNSDQFKNGTLIHFLDIFSAIVNEVKSEDEENSEIIFTEHLKTDLETLLNQLREYSKETPQDIEIEIGKELELNFPQAEGIVTQFSSRVAFYTIENVDDLIIDHWWIDEDEPQLNENVNLDIDEFVKECLPADTNIGSDCKRLLSLSSSPQSSRDRTQAGLCFRTRKVEVAAETRPEKKIFGKFPPRGRGFSRSAAIRGDIFRSRPPNTSRPPSLHVDDFLAMESGQPNSYKREVISNSRGRGRGSSFSRGRGLSTYSSTRGHYSNYKPYRGRSLRVRGSRGYSR